MPKRKSENWWDRLERWDKRTEGVITGAAFILFLLFLAFLLWNPVIAGLILIALVVTAFTIYIKYKTGKWWFKTYREYSQVSGIDFNIERELGQTTIGTEDILAIGAVIAAIIIAIGIVIKTVDAAAGGVIIIGTVGAGSIAKVIRSKQRTRKK